MGFFWRLVSNSCVRLTLISNSSMKLMLMTILTILHPMRLVISFIRVTGKILSQRKIKRIKLYYFVYRHQNLESPYGLAVDPVGNIYVCGRSSNNIHVISEDGKTLRILYGFDHPQFIAFQGNSFKFFVVEESDVNICELF